ncbi:TPA: hypothetical protein ACH3X2_006894 [Trebouxia sp. C0005]
MAVDYIIKMVVQSPDTTAFRSRINMVRTDCWPEIRPAVVNSAGWLLTETHLLQPALLQNMLLRQSLPHWHCQLYQKSTEQINLTVTAVRALPGRQRMYQRRSIWQFQCEAVRALL